MENTTIQQPTAPVAAEPTPAAESQPQLDPLRQEILQQINQDRRQKAAWGHKEFTPATAADLPAPKQGEKRDPNAEWDRAMNAAILENAGIDTIQRLKNEAAAEEAQEASEQRDEQRHQEIMAALKGEMPEGKATDPEATRKAILEQFKLTEDDLADPRIKAMVDDLAERQAQSSQREETAQPEQAAATQATQTQQQQMPMTPQQQFEAYHQGLAAAMEDPTIIDPQNFAQFVQEAGAALGATTPEEFEGLEGFGKVVTKGMLALASTVVPRIMESQMDAYLDRSMPGVREMYQQAVQANSWADAVKAVKSQLPEFGSPEWREEAQKAVNANPYVATIGQGENYPTRVAMITHALARLMAGEKVSPASLTKAAAKAVENYKRTEATLRATRVTGAPGKSTGEFGSAPKPDPVMDSLRAEIARMNAMGSPFGKK